MPIHPLEERKLPPSSGTVFGANRGGAKANYPECGQGHCGVDLYYWRSGLDKNTGRGRAVFAVADGKVISSSKASNAGNFIWLQHEGGWRSHYVHLDRRDVSSGQQVSEGQQIGTLGRTLGTRDMGDPAHLHFALSRYSSSRYRYYDPVPSLRSWPLVAGVGGGALLVAAAALYWYWRR